MTAGTAEAADVEAEQGAVSTRATQTERIQQAI